MTPPRLQPSSDRRRAGSLAPTLLAVLIATVAAPVLAEDDAAGAAAAESGEGAPGPGAGGPGVGGPKAAGRRLTLATGIDLSESVVEQRSSPIAERNGVDAVTRVVPSLRLALRSGRVQASANYSAALSQHSRDEVSRQRVGPAVQQTLDAQLGAELVERHLFLDGRAGIARQQVSAFGRQSAPGSVSENANLTEVATLQIAPSWRSNLGSLAKLDVRLSAAGSNARDSIAGDSTTLGANVALASSNAGRGLTWGLSASHQVVDQRQTRETSSDRVNLSLGWRPDVDWQWSLNAGQESTDIGQIEQRRYDNYGLSMRWSPGPRTELDLAVDRRHFGDGWRVSFQHRTPRTVWRLNSSRDVSSPGSDSGAGGGQTQTAYQLLFAQFATRFPDPVERDVQVREFMRIVGIDPDSLVTGGAANGAITLQQRHDVSAAWTGSRASATFSVFSSDSRVLDNVTPNPADEGRVQTWGWTVNFGWRLTPIWSVSLAGSRQLTAGNASNQGSGLKSVSAALNGRLGPRSTLGINGRYSVFNSPRDPYRETSLGATLGLKF
jgi:uncharacterized protein (PEP-CTERM system associated)